MWQIIIGFILILIIPLFLSYPYFIAGDTAGAVSRITSLGSIILIIIGIIFVIWGIKKLMDE